MNLYEMKCNVTEKLNDGLYVTRVPGGWIYIYYEEDSGSIATSVCFVPLNNEFKGIK